jgi:hypothetical protein
MVCHLLSVYLISGETGEKTNDFHLSFRPEGGIFPLAKSKDSSLRCAAFGMTIGALWFALDQLI